MEVREVDPHDLVISDLNVRKENLSILQLEKSVAEVGVKQPPIVRYTDAENADFEVVIGQRRTLAAQSASLDSIPIVVMDWDDSEAIESSLTENLDVFREEMSEDDKAATVLRLMDLWDCTKSEVGERIGVPKATIMDWMESVRDEWEGTSVEPSFKKDNRSEFGDQSKKVDAMEKPGGNTLKEIRKATGGGEKGEQMVKKVAGGDLSQSDVREIRSHVQAGNDLETAEEKVTQAKEGPNSFNLRFSVAGELADATEAAATANGTTEEDIARTALRHYLERGGWFE